MKQAYQKQASQNSSNTWVLFQFCFSFRKTWGNLVSLRHPTCHGGMAGWERPFIHWGLRAWELAVVDGTEYKLQIWMAGVGQVYTTWGHTHKRTVEEISFTIIYTYPPPIFFVDYSKWVRIAIYFSGQFRGHSSSAPLKEGNGCSPQMLCVDLPDVPVTSKEGLEIQLLYKELSPKTVTCLDKPSWAIMRECVWSFN